MPPWQKAAEIDQGGFRDVRFTSESGHRETLFGCPLCANSGSTAYGLVAIGFGDELNVFCESECLRGICTAVATRCGE